MATTSSEPTDSGHFQTMVILRYVTVSVYVVLLLEHSASLPQEVEFIWKAPGNLARICFLFYRYCTVFGLAVLVYLVTGLTVSLEEKLFVCRRSLAVVAALSVFTMGIADALVMLRVSALWGRQRFILGLLLVSYAIIFSATAVCAAIVVQRLAAHVAITSIANEQDCYFPNTPLEVYGIWIPGLVLDSMVLTLTAWNACARPRTRETALASALYRDGAIVFLILAGLRTANLFVSILSSQFLLAVCISWPLAAITLSRFIFGLHQLEKAQPPPFNEPGMICEDGNVDTKPCGSLECISLEASTYSHRGGYNTMSASFERQRGGCPWQTDDLNLPLQWKAGNLAKVA